MKYGATDQPLHLVRRWQVQEIAEMRPGWTLKEIESLSQRQVHDVFAYKGVKAEIARQRSKKRR